MNARDILAPLLAQPGPWTTVLADYSQNLPDPRNTAKLRHRELLDHLAAIGAPEEDREAVGSALQAENPGDVTNVPSPAARYVVVKEGRVVVDRILLTMVRGDGWAWHGPVLDPFPLLAHDAFGFHALLIEAERDGGTIWHRWPDLATEEDASVGAPVERTDELGRVQGRTDTLHKFSGGGWSQRRYEQHTAELWKQNEKAVAERAGELITAFHPRLVMVAGDVRAVGLLAEALPEAARSVLFTEEFEATPGGEQEELFRRFEEQVAFVAADDERVALERLQALEGGATGRAATGVGEVITALQEGQAELVFTTARREEEREVLALDALPWVATAPEQTYGATVLGRVPASVGIARAALLTDAQVVVTDRGELPAGAEAAALLRWPTGPSRPA